MSILSKNQISSLAWVTPCTHKDCQNDSECLIKENLGVCRCKPGFYGDLCELTPCSENLCENDALCQIEGNSYLCNCPAGFSGLYCEKTPCSDNPCENGGECLVDGDTYKCNCPGLDFISKILRLDFFTRTPIARFFLLGHFWPSKHSLKCFLLIDPF